MKELLSSPTRVVFEHLATVAQALGHVHRIELIESLAQGPRGVDDLATQLGLSVANTSRHLQLLRRTRLVDCTRQGKRIIYSLAGHAQVITLLKALGDLAEHNVEEVQGVVRDFLQSRDALQAITREELLQRLDTVTVLDIRPEQEYAQGHVPGALNIPADELEQRLNELPREREIIAYCRGPYCVLSFDVAADLRARGFQVRRLEDGFPEWKAAGLAVATSG